MISILAQERLLGFALGSVFVGGVVLQQRRGIYRSISGDQSAPYEIKGHVFGTDHSLDVAHIWNKAVDSTLGQLVAYLSSRGW